MTTDVLPLLPKRRGKQMQLMNGEQCLALLPNAPRSAGSTYLYAVAFPGCVLKIGRSKHPRKRLAQHCRRMRSAPEWVHLFSPVPDALAPGAEHRANLRVGELAARVHNSEWHVGATKRSEVLECVRGCIADVRLLASAKAAA